VAYFALKHPQDDVKQLIEHALGRLCHVSLGDNEETPANVLVLEPASAPDLEAGAGCASCGPSCRSCA
jgi:hypothetical protein